MSEERHDTGPGIAPDSADTQTLAHLAAAQGRAEPGRGREPWLLESIAARETFLAATVAYLRDGQGEQTLSHAAEWMLDNLHLAQQALRQVREDMPRSYYGQLPKLVDGPLRGYPRIYDIAQRLVTQSDARLDMERVRRFVALYQESQPLTIGEIWALPVMLRWGILSVLTRAAGDVTGRALAEAEMRASRGPAAPPLLHTLTDDEVVGNCFTSLRTMANFDWRDFFESVSQVEQILRTDPADVYRHMDRATRDRYRGRVEDLALASGQSERDVAAAAIELAQRAGADLSYAPTTRAADGAAAEDATWTGFAAPPAAHVGYYLVDEGRTALERRVGARFSLSSRLMRAMLAHPARVYMGSTAFLTAFLVLGAALYAATQGGSPWLVLLAVGVTFMPALAAAIATVDWIITLIVPPRTLPKLDLAEQSGATTIPDALRSLVVVPALIGDAEDVASLLRQIEQHYLRNPDANLYFALLTDFVDADEQHLPGDEALLEQQRAGIAQLNERYAALSGAAEGPFCMFHRERRWNPKEGRWIGWERKRGKLHELNRWLRGATDTSIVSYIGPTAALRQVKYVITLDADTILGRDGARALIATLAHPLNRAAADPETGRVRRGYGLLQPRTEIVPASANYSHFSRIFAGDIGLDLYTNAVSNVYQDLFGSGIYVGKGIYDIDAFERSLDGRAPENTLLSHDLFEGIHARVGLVTDIVVYEEYPATYLAHVRRLHRWTRGDWQLLPWLLPRLLKPAGLPEVRADFDRIDTWKLLDNLRRSLLAPALLLMLLAGWLFLPGAALVWTVAAVGALAVPPLTGALTPVVRGRGPLAWRQAARSLWPGLRRWLLAVAFLPFEAAQMLDAIGASLVRVLLTRRRLLEWVTAAQSAQMVAASRGPTWRTMLASPLVAVASAVVLSLLRPGSLFAALPLLLLWAIAPEIAFRISQPVRREHAPLTAAQRTALHSLARRTWLFFEDFVGPEDHWLPPDHYQEAPLGKVASYTSPTNVGLLLLSTLAAYDLGYIGAINLVSRLRATFESLAQLERFRGHFLNWYDTRSLAPLAPAYVSTVDSGNLAACLRILGRACEQVRAAPVLRWARWEGMADTLSLLDDFLADLATAQNLSGARDLRTLLGELRNGVLAAEAEPAKWRPTLDYVAGEGWPRLETLLTQLISENAPVIGTAALGTLRIAVGRIKNQISTFHRTVDLLLPGLAWLRERPALLQAAELPDSLRAAYDELAESLQSIPPFAEYPAAVAAMQAAVDRLLAAVDQLPADRYDAHQVADVHSWCDALCEKLAAARTMGEELLTGLTDIETQAEQYFREIDFAFLFDRQREVFHIGYNVPAGKLDQNYYDLLASEARIASLVALAKREVPRSHWMHLARPLTQVNGARALLSWSATMFEYLMPSLFMRSYAGTLLHESATAAVDHQIAYGRRRGQPWGISESGFYALDGNNNYRYRAFGVPGLGYKRDLAEDAVVAPYASLLALPFRPAEVVDNVAHLARLGGLGIYGLYEALDFTASRLPLGRDHAVVREYMAHHQGMIFLALDNYLYELRTGEEAPMPQRFHADPLLQSVDLLLQERVPTDAPLEFPQPGDAAPARRSVAPVVSAPWPVHVHAPMPAVHSLSNGTYSVLISAAGAGQSRWGDIALTRWQPDTTRDNWGTWLYVQDRASGRLWSATHQPAGVAPAASEVRFYPHKAEFQRTDDQIALTLEVAVAPDDDAEIRRVTLHNQGEQARRLALTSYAEVVMTDPATDQRHPAFSKLFIESEYQSETGALLFRRRPRAASDAPVFMAHFVLSEGADTARAAGYESDRAAFLGRGTAGVAAPAALAGSQDTGPGGQLRGSVGATLDPIMALQYEVELPGGATTQLAFITAAAPSREALQATIERYRAWPSVEHAIGQSRARAELELRQSTLSSADLERFQTLLSALLYGHHGLRAEPEVLQANTRGQPDLWAHGISGDYPLLLVRIAEEEALGFVRELLRAHAYWRKRGLMIDLVILNTQLAGYDQGLRDQIQRLLTRMDSDVWLNQRGGIFLLYAHQLNEAANTLLQTTARVILDADAGNLAGTLARLGQQPAPLPAFAPTPVPEQAGPPLPPVMRPADLAFDNGLGGFSPDGREYVIYLDPPHPTPVPWVNVVANPAFGFLVSESGGGYTWALNSGENRLTPWSNDPVTDPPGEALYLRDEETAEVWTPTPQPAGADQPYLVRHGAGYTTFEHHSHGLRQRLRLFVPPDAAVKIVHLRLENATERPRRITATFYAEWLLGTSRAATAQFVIPDFDDDSQALLARNPWYPEFGERVAFAAPSRRLHGLTADRAEFLGRHGTLGCPAALQRIGLSGTIQAGLDPCAALQVHIDLPPGGSDEVWFLLGQGADRAEALALACRYQDGDAVEQAWQAVHGFWDGLLDAVQVRTPEPSMDLLLNRWLLYQSLACRIWGRSGFYQSSGAFGFRDQLQDVMAAVHAAPHLARAHILNAAGRQFEDGDVLHWWHPPSGRGVRTRCSDDLLWLPYVTAHYIEATGDLSILDERVPFLQAPPLAEGEDDRYGEYASTTFQGTLYDHCRRALERGHTAGGHGLPLMGSGDWNDGMNRVGVEGRGESIWLGWFLHATLVRFAAVCEARGDAAQGVAYREQAAALQEALEAHGWDGDWYLRAYYDDGTPLGSGSDSECQIDAIAQSWSVLSGAGDPVRTGRAMDAVLERLVRAEDRLLLLFTPPFDQTPHDPGYIKGYVPGTRENGGQYTHAAIWTTWAYLELGRAATAERLFRLLNPVLHADTAAAVDRYKVEPYVIAADVYSVAPHTGRGGWTWYTGSAAWMYRLGIEGILGLRRTAGGLQIDPCIPPDWPGFEATYRHGSATYHIQVRRDGSSAAPTITVDGRPLAGNLVELHDDGAEHRVDVVSAAVNESRHE